MYVCPSAWNNSAPTERIFMKFDIWAFFSKICRENWSSLKSDNNNGTLHEDLCTFTMISRWILLRMRNVSNKGFRENQNASFMFNNVFRKSFRLWDNVKKYGRAGQATEKYGACWVTKATDTYLDCVILVSFPRQQWFGECAWRLRYTYIACLVIRQQQVIVSLLRSKVHKFVDYICNVTELRHVSALSIICRDTILILKEGHHDFLHSFTYNKRYTHNTSRCN